MRLVDGDKRIKLVMKEFPILTKASMIASRTWRWPPPNRESTAHSTLALMRRDGVLDETGILKVRQGMVGLDLVRARRDMAQPDVTDEIIANFNLARGIRVFQTPAYIVGAHLVTGDLRRHRLRSGSGKRGQGASNAQLHPSIVSDKWSALLANTRTPA